jgi:hypothetical protein
MFSLSERDTNTKYNIFKNYKHLRIGSIHILLKDINYLKMSRIQYEELKLIQ